jgi:hypothetical protein
MIRAIAVSAALVMGVAACGDDDDTADVDPTPDAEYSIDDQPDDAAARWVTPSDGDTVTSPFVVEFEADNVEIVPAGDPAVGEGHFHVNVDIGCVDSGEPIPGPSDAATEMGHRHFGTGVSEAELELEPGTYELCLQLADGVHFAFGETDTITITVE